MPSRRAIILILDGVGVGEAPDSAAYGDEGVATLPHIAGAVGGLRLPNLEAWGLGRVAPIAGVSPVPSPGASFGRMQSRAAGKDSTSGHWEIAGLILPERLPTYPDGFPGDLVREFETSIGRRVLGNEVASGTEILARLGDAHCRTGQPILYTSADSVFQLAAHEDVVPVATLYEWCRIARALLTGPHSVGRVIARPFIGGNGLYERTPRRHDFSLKPPGPTFLDAASGAGVEVTAIGKVGDLFAGRGIHRSLPTTSNAEGMSVLGEVLAAGAPEDHDLVMATLVDFDTLYGHRNDPAGFARLLEEFDSGLPALERALGPGDLLLITADHGNDPTTPGTDHTRELVPLLAYCKGVGTGVDLGTRNTFADVAATTADYLSVPWTSPGLSFLPHLDAAPA